jgi:hypothetical protein
MYQFHDLTGSTPSVTHAVGLYYCILWRTTAFSQPLLVLLPAAGTPKPPPEPVEQCASQLTLDFIKPQAGETCLAACGRLPAAGVCPWNALTSGSPGQDMCLGTATISDVADTVFVAGEYVTHEPQSSQGLQQPSSAAKCACLSQLGRCLDLLLSALAWAWHDGMPHVPLTVMTLLHNTTAIDSAQCT